MASLFIRSCPARPTWLALGGVVLLAWLAAPAAAQDIEQPPPAHISFVEGAVILERAGQSDSSPASMPLVAGDRVRTQNGRAEILFADGSTLHLDAATTVDFQSDDVVRLLAGRVRVNIVGPTRAIDYRIDAPAAWVQITQPGEYRVALLGAEGAREVELAVLRGAAELVNEDGTTRVRAGERAFAAIGLAPSQPYVFNSAAWDAFDRWSELRRSERLGASAEYIPAAVQPYASTLSTYGSWRHEPSYGYVWYPRVHAGWRPYYHGRWSHLRPFGWTWIGHDPWAWPTHHYGRWGFAAGGWFWIPGRVWGPAWVSWAYAPGYVSWCPLGFNNRPVFSFINVNVFGGRRFDRWHGWTVVPHRRFGSGFVNVNVVNIHTLDVRTRNAFATRGTAPGFSGQAVSRPQAPIRVAGGRTGLAVPREGVARAPNAGDRESFRSRGAAGTALSGPGFPAPARAGRSMAVPRGGMAAPAPADRAPAGTTRTVPGATRTAPGGVETPRRQYTPSRRGPESIGAPGAEPSPARSRAVPRRSDAYSPSSTVTERPGGVSPGVERVQPGGVERYTPRRLEPQVHAPDGAIRRAPAQPQGYPSRAVPRSAPPDTTGYPASRPDRGINRAPVREGPSGPPPSAAPPRGGAIRSAPAPRGGEGAPSAAPSSRPRGGQGSAGVATRRRPGGD